jgi:hypothetical protein
MCAIDHAIEPAFPIGSGRYTSVLIDVEEHVIETALSQRGSNFRGEVVIPIRM